MIGVTTSRFKYLFAIAAAFLVVGLAACGPPARGVGLDGISIDGHWATIVEHSGDPATWRLLRLDLETGETTPLAEGIKSFPESSFSPDGQYLTFRTSDGWVLADTTTGRQTQAAAEDESVQFLPYGKLLVIVPTTPGVTQFYVADPADPEERRRLVDVDVRYYFSSQPEYSQLLSRTGQLACPSPTISDRAQWAMVGADGSVFVVVATPDGVSTDELAPRLSDGLAELLDQQEDTVEAFVALERERLRTEINQQAADAGEVLTNEEIERRVDDEVPEWLLRTSFISFGTLSPDGTKLLFLRTEALGGDELEYSLYLVDLTTGEHKRPLSSESRWMPRFAFSPDGQQMLFESNRDGSRSLYLANFDYTDTPTDTPPIAVQGVLSPCWH